MTLETSARLSILVLVFVLATGCIHRPSPNLPKDWHSHEVAPEELEDDPDEARLQIFIVSGQFSCSHTAMRLFCPGKGALFWDPGGYYGEKGFIEVMKKRDVISEKPPTVNEYLDWRSLVPTSVTELFVWVGNEQTVCDLHKQLYLASINEATDGYNSTVPGGFCSHGLSSFLSDYGNNLMTIEPRTLPHNFSSQLYKQAPDRIYTIDPKSGIILKYLPEEL